METKIYRFKLSDEFILTMQEFVNTHRYDDIPLFKEAWHKWYKKNAELVEREGIRLQSIGYEGDISVKIYKSARYYYKNKSLVETPPKKRRPYIRLDPEILKCIDDHIGCSCQQKPSAAFRSFMEIQAETVQKSARILHDKGLMQDDIDAKIKKTFKNRYFRLITK